MFGGKGAIVLVHRPRAGTASRRGGGSTYDRDGVANRPRELGRVSSLASARQRNESGDVGVAVNSPVRVPFLVVDEA